MSHRLPAPLTAAERADVQRARLDLTVGVERLNAGHWEGDAPLRALRGTGLFKSVDYIDRLASPPDLIVRGDTISESIPLVPILTIGTLGVFPTWWKEKYGYAFSFHAPNSDEKTIEVSFAPKTENVMGWISGFLNMSGNWTEEAPFNDQRLYDRLALALAAREQDIRRSAARKAESTRGFNGFRPARALQSKAEAAQAAASGLIRIPGKNYEIGKYEVTQGQWTAIMDRNPSHFKTCGDACPVDGVSWNDAQEFIQKLNARTGKQYRLPTEAEWEFACYGGRRTDYCGGDMLDAAGWHKGNSDDQPHPVGRKQANGYGLYDMTGNVGEWTSGCPGGNCAKRVIRGGAYNFDPESSRAAEGIWDDAAARIGFVGFRLAKTTN